ncbi:hypothetical protein [Algoriphagus sp. Y33]|uniref:hypothetical protein n=1 Tax=Algoriphagus sp. Y33 TaxID=2772483 RepID=UPI001786DD78|nr:hypothetical protein [Algoriphagus sp. Y33]
MKIRLLFILALLIVSFSCQENKEPDSFNKMAGRWEQIFEVNGLYESYHFIEFKEDGTFHMEMSARTMETGENMGFRGIADGSYQVQDNIVIMTEEVLFSRDYDDPAYVDDNTFFPKEALIPSENTSEISYKIESDFSELRFICPENSFDCMEFTTYVKVTD